MNKKNGAYNGEIQNAIAELFKTITPYVYHEARWGFADSLVYIPDKTISEKIQQDKEGADKTPLKICRFYNRNMCSLKTQKWDWNIKPGHSYIDVYNAEKQGKKIKKIKKVYIWTHRETGEIIESEKFDIVNIPKIKKQCMCDGKTCEHYLETLESKQVALRTLDKGLHLFEIKTDRDNVKRFGYQLAHYCLMGDYLWLVLETKKVPEWVPPFVGIMRYETETLYVERQAIKIDRFPYLNESVIKKANGSIESFADCADLYKFIQDWFINSVFQWKYDGKNIVDMSYLNRLIKFKRHMDKKGNDISIKKLDEFLS